MTTYLLTILVFLAIIAATSTILTTKGITDTIGGAFSALENLYRGVFA